MATATEVIANETEIKQAMGIPDEIELDRELAISIAQADRGQTMPIEEAERIMKERFASGYYARK